MINERVMNANEIHIETLNIGDKIKLQIENLDSGKKTGQLVEITSLNPSEPDVYDNGSESMLTNMRSKRIRQID